MSDFVQAIINRMGYMKKIKNLFLLIIGAGIIATSFAGNYSNCTGHVKQVGVFGDGYAFIDFDTEFNDYPINGDIYYKKRIVLPADYKNKKEILAIALSAKANGDLINCSANNSNVITVNGSNMLLLGSTNMEWLTIYNP